MIKVAMTSLALYSVGRSARAAPKGNQIVFVLGGPGAGKGTNCERLASEKDIKHLSAGDLLRAEVKSQSKDGEMISEIIQQGKIVPSSITVALLKKAIQESPQTQFLIDGFPRNAENNDAWAKDMSDISVRFLLFLDCPEEVLRERLLSRGRSDDNTDTIMKRFKTFENETKPVVEYYNERGLVRKISSVGSREEVYERISKLFD